ncbi:hypothetical protein JB92DRAFT_2830476 [Gautieria morchelliformis]|nr:hypothetical protein JB92DRAFT_2830476 [Gautieria morchelliformis]
MSRKLWHELLKLSIQTVYSVTQMNEDNGLHVIDAKSIHAVVSIQPHKHPGFPEEESLSLAVDVAQANEAHTLIFPCSPGTVQSINRLTEDPFVDSPPLSPPRVSAQSSSAILKPLADIKHKIDPKILLKELKMELIIRQLARDFPAMSHREIRDWVLGMMGLWDLFM